MRKTLKRLLAVALVLCMAMSYIVPATYAAKIQWDTKYYDFDLCDDRNGGIYRGTQDIRLSEKVDEIAGFYETEKNWNWKYRDASEDLLNSDNKPEGVRFNRSYGTRIYSGEGSWLAYTIKSPGEGRYTVSLNYALSYNNGIAAVYILPADTEDIITATDPSNRVGLADMCDGTGTQYSDGNRDAQKVYQGYHAFVGYWDFEADKEYIVVFESYARSPYNGAGQMHLFGLEMTPGEISKSQFDQNDSGDWVRDSLVKENVISVADAGAMAAVWEVNGQDYYFLPLEGGLLLVFNLDTWELVKSVNTGISYPSSTAVVEMDDGTVEVFVGGNGKTMYSYNPYTEKGYTTVKYTATEGLEGEKAIRGIDAHNGKVYIGLSSGGHLASYDPKTGKYENLGDMIDGSFTSEDIVDGEVTGEENGGIGAIDCYGNYLYMTAVDAKNAYLIQYDLVNKEIVKRIDVTDIIKPASAYRGLSVLGNGDYLIAGGKGFNGLAMVDLHTMELVTEAEAKAMGLSSTAWENSAGGNLTEIIDGKQYMTVNNEGLWEYDVATKRFTKIGKASNAFVTSGKQSVTLKIDESKATPVRSETAPEQLYLFTKASNGQPRLYNPSASSAIRGAKISFDDLMKQEYGTGGADLRINTISEDGNILYLGAFNTPSATAYDVTTGEFTYYLTEGQTDSQVWYEDKLYAGNYSACVVYQIDMENADNKAVISNMIHYDQKRIHTMAAGDGYIFAGTIPTTHENGGGVGWYDTVTGKEHFIHFKQAPTVTTPMYVNRNGVTVTVPVETVAPEDFSELWDLAVNGLVYQDGLLYGCTTRAGGSGSSYAENASAQIFIYDYENDQILSTLDLREYIPAYLPGTDGTPALIDYIGGIAADPTVPGRFWGVVSDVVFTFSYNRATGDWDVQVVYDFEHKEYENAGGREKWNAAPVFDVEHNNIYVNLNNNGMTCITLSNWQNATFASAEKIGHIGAIFYNIGADDNLYYTDNADLRMIPINLTDAEWAAAEAIDARIENIGTVTAASAAEIQAIRADYEALPVRQHALVQNEQLLLEAEAELLEQQIVAEAESVSPESIEVLEDYLAQYNNLTERQKRYVKEYDTLTEAYADAIELKEAEEEQANAVQAQINALKVTSLSDSQTVADARAAYEALNERQKPLVDTAKLVAAEALLVELEEAAAVQEQINALPLEATLENEPAVIAAREAYEALSDVAKAQVNTEKLLAAEKAIEDIKLAAKTEYVYDFKLYENPDFMDSTIGNGTAAISTVFTKDNNLYSAKVSDGSKDVRVYNWFFRAYPQTINWAPEACKGTTSDANLFKDFTVTAGAKKGLKVDLSSTGSGWGAIRVHVPVAGEYRIDASFFDNVPALKVYILSTDTGYTSANDRETVSTIPALLETAVPVGQIGATGLTDTITDSWNCEAAGDYIFVFQQTTTARYMYLDTLTLTKCNAKVGDQVFGKLEDAFAYQIANNAACVTLNQDMQVDELEIPAGVVLDLNGKALTVETVDSAGHIVDSSEKDTGVLKVADWENSHLNENNSQLPIYDATAEGYRFFKISVKSVAITGKDSGNAKYWFKVSCENFDEIYKLIQSDNELMNITVRMTWDNGGYAEASADPSFLLKWAEKYVASGDNFYITVTAVNTEGYDNFSLIPCMEANGVAIKEATK